MTLPQLKDEPVLPFELSLRIQHPSMDPADITAALAIEPEHSFKAGDEHRSSRGAALQRSESYWLATLSDENFPVKSPSLGTQVDAAFNRVSQNVTWAMVRWLTLLSRVERSHSFFSQLRKEGGRATLLTQLSPSIGTLTLAPETAKMIGELGIQLEIDIEEDG